MLRLRGRERCSPTWDVLKEDIDLVDRHCCFGWLPDWCR